MLGKKGYDLGFMVKAAAVIAAMIIVILIIRDVGSDSSKILAMLPDFMRFT